MKKGFTLVELLAVLVILAVILTLTAPIMINLIDQNKKSSAIKSAELYLRAVLDCISANDISGDVVVDNLYYIMEDGNLCSRNQSSCSGDYIKVDTTGTIPTGTIVIENGNIASSMSINSEKKTLIQIRNYNFEYINGNLEFIE